MTRKKWWNWNLRWYFKGSRFLILFFLFFLLRECRRLLPFHTTRTLLCMTILVVLFLELCESFLTWISCSSIITIVAILYCWILHRNTEIKDGFGVAYTTGIFAAIGLSRAWKFTYLYRSVSCLKIFFLLLLMTFWYRKTISENFQIWSIHFTRSIHNHSDHRYFLRSLCYFGFLHVVSYSKLINLILNF